MASLAQYIPFLRYKTVKSKAWTTTGNTDTVTDSDVVANSHIAIQNTSIPVGNWKVVVSSSGGSFTVTSDNSESATTTTYNYLIL